MIRKRIKLSSKKSSDSLKLQLVSHPATHPLRMSPLPPFQMPPPQMIPPEFIGGPVQSRSYDMPMTGSLPQPCIFNAEFPAPAFREMSPVQRMLFPGTPKPVPLTAAHGFAEAPPSVNITWKGNTLIPPPVLINKVNGPMQPRANVIRSPMMVPSPGIPSMPRASVMPQPCVPHTRYPVPAFRRNMPLGGNISPSSPIHASPATTTSLSLSVYGVPETWIPIEESNDGALNINSLPEELLIIMFSYLTQNELGQIARVCRKWNELTKSIILWKKVKVKFYGHHGSQTEIANKFLLTLPSCVTDIRLDFMFCSDWTEPLDFEELSKRLQERCPQLEVLFLKGAELSVNLPSVIDLCSIFLCNLKSLTLRSAEFTERRKIRNHGGISKIEILNLYACSIKKANELPFSKMPNLKEIHLTNTNTSDSWFEIDPIYLNRLEVLYLGFIRIRSKPFQIIRNNVLYLKELYLCGVFLFPSIYYSINLKNSVFPYLKTLCLRYCCSVTCEDVVSLIQSCPSLENVYVDKKVAESYAAHPYVLIERCKLEIVKVNSCYFHYPRHFYA